MSPHAERSLLLRFQEFRSTDGSTNTMGVISKQVNKIESNVHHGLCCWREPTAIRCAQNNSERKWNVSTATFIEDRVSLKQASIWAVERQVGWRVYIFSNTSLMRLGIIVGLEYNHHDCYFSLHGARLFFLLEFSPTAISSWLLYPSSTTQLAVGVI